MTDAAPSSEDTDAPSAPRRPRYYTRAEARLFQLSPLGPWPTAIVVFVLLYGGFLAAATVQGMPLFMDGESGREPVLTTMVAMILCAIIAIALLSTELARRGTAADAEAIGTALTSADPDTVTREPVAWRGPLIVSALIGAGIGVALNVLIGLTNAGGRVIEYFLSPIGGFFLVCMILAFGLMLRGIVSAWLDDRRLNRIARTDVAADPLDPERLHVFGRLALRSAFSWLAIASVVALFIIVDPRGVLGLVTLVISIGGAIYVFVSTLIPVQAAARRARDAALLDIRARLRTARDLAFAGDVDAAAALPGLLAYEARIERSGVWPISTPVTSRFLAYALVPVLAWFGSALAQAIVSRAAV